MITPKISVAMITYNHEKFLRKAIDSVLEQEFNGELEIIIADDASTDNTQKIIKEYSKKFPNVIHTILRKENIGATKNLYDVLMQCSGKYIAILEGDDYWSKKDKLKKQMEFLEDEKNKGYIASVSKCYVVDENDKIIKEKENFLFYDGEIYDINICKKWILSGQLGTHFFRNIFVNSEEDFSIIYKASNWIGDRTLELLLSSRGNIYCFNEFMSCYRFIVKEGGSNFSSIMLEKDGLLEDYKCLINLNKYCKTKLGMPDFYKEEILFRSYEILKRYMKDRNYKNKDAIKYVYSTNKYNWIIFSIKNLFSSLIKKFFYKKNNKVN